jgi:hypothetical protein
MTTYRALPTYTQPLTTGPNLSASWYRWMHDTDVGTPPSAETAVTVTASPFAYQAAKKGFLIITGGTVSLVQFTRVGTYSTGVVSGMFPVDLGDTITVTYSGAPTITFVPT